MAINNPYSIENFVTTGWRGLFPLWIAFWGYYVLGRIIVLAAAAVLLFGLGFFGWFLAIIIWIPYWIWSIVMLWRCAFNTDYYFLGYIVRVLIYAEVVFAIFNLPRMTFTG
jgi:hypothetical protein